MKIYDLKNNKEARMKISRRAQKRQREVFSNKRMRELTFEVYLDLI